MVNNLLLELKDKYQPKVVSASVEKENDKEHLLLTVELRFVKVFIDIEGKGTIECWDKEPIREYSFSKSDEALTIIDEWLMIKD